MKILITGGAGFIASHLADALIARGDSVVALDNLDPQVHSTEERPSYLNDQVQLLVGDVRDPETMLRALSGVEAVVYNAAAVGVGQSMYKIDHYVDVNSRGAAVFWEAVLKTKTVKRIIVASSMSVYGEGMYVDDNHRSCLVSPRSSSQLANKQWEMLSPEGKVLAPVPTSESKPLEPTSVYAITKRDQEELFITLGRTYGIPVTAFRYFNVIGSRQALSNPYTGVAAIFCSRLMNSNPPLVFEDGKQLRDFVHVADVVQANLLALDSDSQSCDVMNIGSGSPISIADLARQIALAVGSSMEPEITNQARAGDIRHCYADISKARSKLGYEPKYSIQKSIQELTAWLASQTAEDKVDSSFEELKKMELLQ